jgi:basic amino acid/polyamine antiporter, APA family
VAGIVSGLAAICYAEFASPVPIAGSAYTYSYATLGELIAWIIGWDLILEYAVGAAAVSIGWSGYIVDFLKSTFGIALPQALTASPFSGGIINLPAVLIILLVTTLLVLGTSESARVNNVIVVGFDQISTSAEETRNPAKDLPMGIFLSLLICSVLYILVTAVLTGMVSYKQLNVASPVSHAMILIGLNAAGSVISIGAIWIFPFHRLLSFTNHHGRFSRASWYPTSTN